MSETRRAAHWRPASRQVFDFLLNLLMAAPMACIVCGGFHVAPQVQYNIGLLLVVPALYLLAMFAFGRTRVFALVGAGVVVLGTGIALLAVAAMCGVPDLLADVEENPCVFVAVCAVVTSLIHLLSRTFPGSLILFVAGAVTVGVIQFLYLWNYVILTVIFLVFSVAMVVFKYYQRAFALADAKDKPRYGAAFAAGLATSVIVVAVGMGLFFGIDALFHPQALQLKPFKEYFAFEQVDVMGIANSTSVDNEDKTSSNTDDTTTSEGGQQDDDNTEENENQNDQQSQGAPTEGSMVSYTQEALEDTFEVIAYGLDWWQQFLLVALLVLLVVVPIAVRKLLRWRWHKTVLQKGPEEQVADFYLFFLSRFARIGLGKPDSTTALAFAANSDEALRTFESNAGGVTLAELSDAYTRCAYGGEKAGEGVVERFDAFYHAFFKSAREHVGRLRYLYKFFRL